MLIALSVATSSISFAQADHGLVNSPDAPEKMQTMVLPAKNGKVDVVIGKIANNLLIQVVDQQGKTLSSKPVTKQDSNTRFRFDLNELPDGIYEVVITEGSNRQVKDVVLDTHTSASYRTVTLS